MHRHATDIFTVFVSDGKTTSTFFGQQPSTDSVRAGDVKIRYAGFTHSTRNVARIPFRAVILEFTKPQGMARKDTRPPGRQCNGESCTRLEHISCTDTYCSDEVWVDPGGSLPLPAGSAAAVIAVSDYEFSDAASPRGHRRLNGGVEYIASSLPQQWTNKASIPAHVVVVAFH